jgi:hypothetical protein
VASPNTQPLILRIRRCSIARQGFALLSVTFLATSYLAAQTSAPAGSASLALPATSAALPDAPEVQSSSDSTRPSPDTQHQANQQIKEQESQRILGVVPMFGVSYRSDAVSLSPKQKFDLAFHSALDPATFGIAFIVAGYREALDEDIGFRWGPEGYMRRVGASYLDTFDGAMIGNTILPSILHQDPRFFRLGHGSTAHRILYAAATTVMCKHDNTGKWEPNYSNIGGNLAAGALSNLYYPSGTGGWGQTVTNGLVVTLEGTAGGEFDEFWPDISRKLFHRDPTHGRDTSAAAPAVMPQK